MKRILILLAILLATQAHAESMCRVKVMVQNGDSSLGVVQCRNKVGVEVLDTVAYGSRITINVWQTATSDPCYQFHQWSDNVTHSEREVLVYKDTIIIAQYSPRPYLVTAKTKKSGDIGGTIRIDSLQSDFVRTSIVCGDSIEAIPNELSDFNQWSDGVTDNPRVFQASDSLNNFIAEFIPHRVQVEIQARGQGAVEAKWKNNDSTFCDTITHQVITINKGNTIQLRALPQSENYRFLCWSRLIPSQTPTTSFRAMNENSYIGARFESNLDMVPIANMTNRLLVIYTQYLRYETDTLGKVTPDSVPRYWFSDDSIRWYRANNNPDIAVYYEKDDKIVAQGQAFLSLPRDTVLSSYYATIGVQYWDGHDSLSATIHSDVFTIYPAYPHHKDTVIRTHNTVALDFPMVLEKIDSVTHFAGKKPEEKLLQVYPNIVEAGGEMQINGLEEGTSYRVSVWNAQGRMLWCKNFCGTNWTLSAERTPGCYMVCIEDKKQKSVIRYITTP